MMQQSKFSLNKMRSATTRHASLYIRPTAASILTALRRQAGPVAVPAYQRPPAMDIGHTQLHEGGGTSSIDPYTRVRPNQVSVAPVSTAPQAQRGVVLTDAERADPLALARKSMPLGEWLRPSLGSVMSSAPLAQYIRAMRIDGLQNAATAASTVAAFERTALPEAAKAAQRDPVAEMQRWTTLVGRFVAEESLHLFDPAAFQAYVQSLRDPVVAFLDAAHGEELRTLYDIYARNAVQVRNMRLDAVAAFVEAQGQQAGGAAHERFHNAVVAADAELFEASVPGAPARLQGDALRAQWELTRGGTPPNMKPATALAWLALAAVMPASAAAQAAAAQPAPTPERLLSSLPVSTLTAFAERHLPAMLSVATLQQPVAALLMRFGLSDAARTVEEVVAALSVARTERARRTQELVPLFKDLKATLDLCKRTLAADAATTSPATQKYLFELLRSFMEPDAAATLTLPQAVADMRQLETRLAPVWPSAYAAVAERMLAHEELTETLRDVIHKGGVSLDEARAKEGTLLARPVAEKLRQLRTSMSDVYSTADATLAQLRAEILTKVPPQRVAQLVIASGAASAEPLQQEFAARKNSSADAAPLQPALFSHIIRNVKRAHSTWVASGVLPAADTVPTPTEATRVALLMFLRMTYIPHAGGAIIASRHRRRIGPIATRKEQFNIEAEVGFAEHYDNQQYKQWDWQGWYQRMVDVFYRNVSIRARVSDLRRLDNEGRPFVDMQTERRLRIVAESRVGAGMVKLDTDRFEDRSDNLDFGTGKLQELLSEAKKAQLGSEYWPTVEVKVRHPSGQSKMRYSLMDWARVEAESKEMLVRYKAAKAKAIFVPPNETWLRTAGETTGAAKEASTGEADADAGYDSGSLFGGQR
jgi:hypothetical protein